MTIQEALNQAALLIGAIESGGSLTADESADLLRALNQMMAMWAEDDKDLQWPPQDTLTDDFPLQMWTEQPIVYNLAVLGATLFDLPVPNHVAFIAGEGQSFIAKTLINNKTEDKDMSHLPSGGGRWSIITDSRR